MLSDLAAVILCGGKGTRMWPATADIPKPMLPVGDRPALEHLLEIYARQGVMRFILAAGYRVEVIEDWAAARHGWDIVVRDTGEETGTGERLRLCAATAGGRFFATYGDGLGNVDLGALLAHHVREVAKGARATLTTVPLPSQYGTVDIDAASRVERFNEKPLLRDHWINAGFFVFEQDVFADVDGDDLERDVLPALAAAGGLSAYRHAGFWKSMDTQKDVRDMTSLASEVPVPWLTFAARS